MIWAPTRHLRNAGAVTPTKRYKRFSSTSAKFPRINRRGIMLLEKNEKKKKKKKKQ
jgi:hypothetical protein